MGVENRVGVHTSSYYKWIFPESIGSLTEKIKAAGGDFCAYIPNSSELFLGKEKPELGIPVEYVDEAWSVDRRIESVTPFASSQPGIKRVILSMAYPEESVKNALAKFSDASLIERWPFFPVERLSFDRMGHRKSVIDRRNHVLEKYSSCKTTPKITLDVHTPNIGLTPGEIQNWFFEDRKNRKLAVTALISDERPSFQGFPVARQVDLIEPLLSLVGVVILKPEPVVTSKWGGPVDLYDVYKAILNPKDRDSKYAVALRNFINSVGRGIPDRVDLIVKDKSMKGIDFDGKKVAKKDFIARYVEFAKMVVSTL